MPTSLLDVIPTDPGARTKGGGVEHGAMGPTT